MECQYPLRKVGWNGSGQNRTSYDRILQFLPKITCIFYVHWYIWLPVANGIKWIASDWNSFHHDQCFPSRRWNMCMQVSEDKTDVCLNAIPYLNFFCWEYENYLALVKFGGMFRIPYTNCLQYSQIIDPLDFTITNFQCYHSHNYPEYK